MAFYDAFREQGERYTEEQLKRRQRGPDLGGGSGNSFSWFNNPAGIRDFAGDKNKQDVQDAQFLAKYGMTAADMVEAYRLGKVQEGTFGPEQPTKKTGSGLQSYNGLALPDTGLDVGQRFRQGLPVTPESETIAKTKGQKSLESKYAQLRTDISAMSEAQKAALNRRNQSEADKGTDEFSRLEKAKKLLIEQEKTSTPGPQQEGIRKQLSDVNNRMGEMLNIPMQPYTPPKRPEWSWADLLPGGRAPQADYDKLYGKPKGGVAKVAEQSGTEGKDKTGKPIIFNQSTKRWEYK